jgi:acyl-CoA thioesterase-1
MNLRQTEQWRHLLFLLLLVVGVFYGNGATAQAQPEKLLILGDSLSAGYGMDRTQSWVALWQQRLGQENKPLTLINASVSGETLAGGLSRLPALLEKHHPQWLMVELGANDALRGQDLQQSAAQLQRIIDMAQAQQIKVLLLGIRLPTNYGVAYDQQLQQMYQQIAQQYAIPLDPFFLEDIALLPDAFQADALHPTVGMQPQIMKRVADWFEKETK